MENKKKRRKRKILIALLLFLFTGVLFSTSTYAWFTANRTVTIEQLDVNVGAETSFHSPHLCPVAFTFVSVYVFLHLEQV